MMSLLIEDKKFCKLENENTLSPIGDFDFGKTPTADRCNIVRRCMENLKIEQISFTPSQYWFLSNLNSVLFYFFESPVEIDEYKNTFLSKKNFNSEQLIAVKVKTKLIPNKFPTNVKLRIGYSQIENFDKKIINASLNFFGFQPFETNRGTPRGNKFYEYDLYIEWVPLSHTELTIEFALSWKLYLVLFFAVGIIAFLMVFFFMIFNLLISRKKKNYFHFRILFRKIWTNAFKGTYIVLFCFAVYFCIIGFLCFFKIMNYSFKNFICDSNDNYCFKYAPFDYLVELRHFNNDSLNSVRNFRFGFCLIQFGIFCLVKNFSLMDNKKNTEEGQKTKESLNKNVWLISSWKKIDFLRYASILLIIELYLVHFSFTKTFADNVWVFLGVYKCIGIIVSTTLNYFARNSMYSGIFGGVVGLIESLATLGAANFLDFLQSNIK